MDLSEMMPGWQAYAAWVEALFQAERQVFVLMLGVSRL